MIIYYLLGFYLIAFVLAFYSMMRSSPIGYEDKEGFHYEEQLKIENGELRIKHLGKK